MAISIIIPVYNGERYIRSCYRTLLHQTFKEWEAVFVNDGSVDNSQFILEDIRHDDKRIKVINKVNEGVAIARKVGVEHASNDIITFLDVDDTLAAGALQSFEDGFITCRADIVITGINIVSDRGLLCNKIAYKPMITTGENALYEMSRGYLRWQVCAKAFRRNLLTQVKTPNGLRSAEDMVVCMQAMARAKTVCISGICEYNYVQVSTSVTHSKAKEIIHDGLAAGNFLDNMAGDLIGKDNIDSMFMLLTSASLRAGADPSDQILKDGFNKHFRLSLLWQLGAKRAISLLLYRYMGLNLARYF